MANGKANPASRIRNPHHATRNPHHATRNPPPAPPASQLAENISRVAAT